MMGDQKIAPVDNDAAQIMGQKPGVGVAEVQIRSLRPDQQHVENKKWRDFPFAILFGIDLAVVVAFAVIWGHNTLNKLTGTNSDSSSSGPVVNSSEIGSCLGIGVVMALLAISIALAINRLSIQNAGCVIQFMLWFNVGISACVAGIGFLLGNVALGFFGSLMTMGALCYARRVAARVPFAAANIKVASAAVNRYYACYLVALGVAFLQIVWILIWLIAMLGGIVATTKDPPATTNNGTKVLNELCDSNAECVSNVCSISKNNRQKHCMMNLNINGTATVLYVFMLFSLYWATQVLKNIAHTTVAGTVASWWYRAEPRKATWAALKRSCTTSFGSICLGSLLVAIIKTLRALANQSKSKNGNNAAACLASCLLACLESFAKYINRWAYVYVGIYGYTFVDAGRAVFELFRQRGFEAIINDDLVGDLLTFVSVSAGLVCALIGVLAANIKLVDIPNGSLLLGIIGFIIGVGVSFAPLSVIDSAVATIFVCFAEDPAALQQSHPDHYSALLDAWYTMHPSLMAQGCYPRV